MSSLADKWVRQGLIRTGYESRMLDVKSGQVHVLSRSGQGTLSPMVFIHGLGAQAAHLWPLIERLRRHLREVWLPDLPAHGRSPVPPEGLTSANLRNIVFDTLHHLLEPEPMVLFGNSLGGLAAIRYTAAHPEKVRALILCSPGGAAMSPTELQAFRKTFQFENVGEARSFVDKLLGRPSLARYLIGPTVHKTFRDTALSRLLESVEPADMLAAHELRELKVPVLLIWGQRDQILPSTQRDWFLENLPNHAVVVQPPKMGHSPYLGGAGLLSQHMLRFLRSL
jgi:pimeloyl-ACP methyl ester carboxylesterase